MRRRIGVFPALFICLLLALMGCGRKGDPIPNHSMDAFAFGALRAEASAGGAITVHGTVTGAAQNVEYLVLEIEAVAGELCQGCPFLAQDTYRIDAGDAMNNNTFSFVYRPVFTGEIYRWRVIGHNVYAGLPSVTSPIQTVVMPWSAGALSLPGEGE